MENLTRDQIREIETTFPKLNDLVRSKEVDVIHIDINAFDGKSQLLYPTIGYIVSSGKTAQIFRS